MKIGTHKVEVIDWLHAKFQLLKLHLTRGFLIGSRVSGASREIWAFGFTTFCLATPLNLKKLDLDDLLRTQSGIID